MPGRSVRQDPLKVFDFTVDIDGFKRIGFTEVTGLSKKHAVVTYREGGSNHSPQKSLGLTEYPPVRLKRGQIVDPDGEGEDDFYTWSQQCSAVGTQGFRDSDYRRGATIIQWSANGIEVRRWRLVNCLMSEFKPMSDLNGNESADSYEEIEIEHEGFDREGGPAAAPRGQSLSPSLGIGS